MNRKRGLRILAEMLGGEDAARQLQRQWRSLSPDLERYIVGFVAGEIWARPQLDRRTRSLCTVAALAALGRPRALRLNVRLALNNGASVEQICEALLHIAPYAGFPAVWEGLEVAHEVFGSVQAGRGKKIAGRRGLR